MKKESPYALYVYLSLKLMSNWNINWEAVGYIEEKPESKKIDSNSFWVGGNDVKKTNSVQNLQIR
jgi:hypothetical protein